jgi:hypothetical protein
MRTVNAEQELSILKIMTANTLAFPAASRDTKSRLIAELLLSWHPHLALAAALAPLHEGMRQYFSKVNAPWEADRTRLSALTEPELLSLIAQQKAQREAAQFYNQGSAKADFQYWSKMEHWEFDEAIALLLGKNPQVVTWAAMKPELKRNKHLAGTGFSHTYEKLRDLAERAAVMQAPRLKPVDVVRWAQTIALFPVPESLRLILDEKDQPKIESVQEINADLSVETRDTCRTTSDDLSNQTTKKWTDDQLLMLRQYRNKYGTKAAAIHFDISPQFIRKIQPQESKAPTGYRAFNFPHR